MQLSLTIVQFIILFSSSSPTLASNYALPLRLVSRQSSFFCPVVPLEYPSTFTQCGNGYITPGCTCCSGGSIGCLTQTQTCVIDAAGEFICCDNTSPNCSPTSGGGGGCAADGKVDCGGNGCIPGGYLCCPNDPDHGGCPSDHFCCNRPDGTPACCAANSDNNSPSSTAAEQTFASSTEQTFASSTEQTFASSTSSTSGATPTSAEPSNFGTRPSKITSAMSTSSASASTAISGPSSSISSSLAARVYVVGAARGSHSFIFQPAMLFVAIYYFLFVGVSA